MNRICSERKLLGMTQQDLAKALEVDKATVNRWERNGGVPDKKLVLMRGLFNCDLDWLLGLSDIRVVVR